MRIRLNFWWTQRFAVLLGGLLASPLQAEAPVAVEAPMKAKPVLPADVAPRTLFSFETPEAARRWQTVNDGVMGGRSDGRFQVNPEGNLEFFGMLSLENNGGFASVRSLGTKLGLARGRAGGPVSG